MNCACMTRSSILDNSDSCAIGLVSEGELRDLSLVTGMISDFFHSDG